MDSTKEGLRWNDKERRRKEKGEKEKQRTEIHREKGEEGLPVGFGIFSRVGINFWVKI